MSIGQKGMVVAAKALAITGADLFADAQLVADAKADFKKQLDGTTYQSVIPEARSRRSIIGTSRGRFRLLDFVGGAEVSGPANEGDDSRSSIRLIGVGVPALLAASIVIASSVARPRGKFHDEPDRQGVFLAF